MSTLNVFVDFANWCIACAASGSTLPGGVAVAGGLAAAAVISVSVLMPPASSGSTAPQPPTHAASGDGSHATESHERVSPFDYGDKEEELEAEEL